MVSWVLGGAYGCWDDLWGILWVLGGSSGCQWELGRVPELLAGGSHGCWGVHLGGSYGWWVGVLWVQGRRPGGSPECQRGPGRVRRMLGGVPWVLGGTSGGVLWVRGGGNWGPVPSGCSLGGLGVAREGWGGVAWGRGFKGSGFKGAWLPGFPSI